MEEAVKEGDNVSTAAILWSGEESRSVPSIIEEFSLLDKPSSSPMANSGLIANSDALLCVSSDRGGVREHPNWSFREER